MAKTPKTKCPKCNGTGEIVDITQLRDRRIKSGLRLGCMALATGKSITHVSGAERGKHPAHEPFLSRYVAKLLNEESKIQKRNK